jgi:hypothetical protein
MGDPTPHDKTYAYGSFASLSRLDLVEMIPKKRMIVIESEEKDSGEAQELEKNEIQQTEQKQQEIIKQSEQERIREARLLFYKNKL